MKGGEWLSADELDESATYTDLTCSMCGKPVTTVFPKEKIKHFRHLKGEQCALKKAEQIRFVIQHFLEQAKTLQLPYTINIRQGLSFDLAAAGSEIRCDQMEFWRKIDLRFCLDGMTIDMVIAINKRTASMGIGGKGHWVTIDARTMPDHHLMYLRHGIDLSGSPFFSHFGFPQVEPTRRPTRSYEDTIVHKPVYIDRAAQPSPNRRQPGETIEEFRRRAGKTMPWLNRRA